MLPDDALNNGVTITLTATEPAKNGVNDQVLCGVSLNRNAGRCQEPPDDAENQPGPNGRELPLQKRKRQPSPSEFLDWVFNCS